MRGRRVSVVARQTFHSKATADSYATADPYAVADPYLLDAISAGTDAAKADALPAPSHKLIARQLPYMHDSCKHVGHLFHRSWNFRSV